MASETELWTGGFGSDPTAEMRLVCFPFAGAGASVFAPWGRELPRRIEATAVHLPGREKRWKEPSAQRIEPLLDALARVIPALPRKPPAFYGHSYGALLAFELARRLRRERSVEPVHLFVGAFAAPHLSGDAVAGVPASDLEFLLEMRRRYGGIPDELLADAELMRLYVPPMRADFEALGSYVHRDEEPLDCPITVFGGTEDLRLPRERLEGWSRHTRGRFRLAMIPGGHFFVKTHRARLIAEIAGELAPASAMDSRGPPR